jgi:hypothetical protein
MDVELRELHGGAEGLSFRRKRKIAHRSTSAKNSEVATRPLYTTQSEKIVKIINAP